MTISENRTFKVKLNLNTRVTTFPNILRRSRRPL